LPLIIIKGSKSSGMSQLTLPEMIERNKKIHLKKAQEKHIKQTTRFYKGKYPCVILDKGKKKALVLWLCSCDVVGNKELGYKSVRIFDTDIINYMRLLHYEYKG